MLPALVVMILIFYFSSCDATESSQSSSRVVQLLIDFGKRCNLLHLSGQEEAQFADWLTLPVRKCAHMTEYAVLSWCFFLWIYNLVDWYPYIPAFICTFLYAATDEYHQLYVPGRAGRVTDVLIDSAGALIALFLLSRILRALHRRREKKAKGEA
jgi:VanZ family protein